MGRFTLPSIEKLEDVVDLLINHEKYIKYMQDLSAAHADVKLSLGILDTKEKADKMLSEALTLTEQATKFDADTRSAVKKHQREVEEKLAKATDDLQKQVAQLHQDQFQLTEDKRKHETVVKGFVDYQAKAKASLEQEMAENARLKAEFASKLAVIEEKRKQAEAQLKAWS